MELELTHRRRGSHSRGLEQILNHRQRELLTGYSIILTAAIFTQSICDS